jgi:hypothetical protein
MVISSSEAIVRPSGDTCCQRKLALPGRSFGE